MPTDGLGTGMPSAGSDLVGAGVDLASQGLDIWSTARQNKKQREWNTKESEKQWQRELEMWNKSNLYNTPAAQMERYKQAGLNPNLIYGQGGPGLSANALPEYSKAEGQFELPSLKSNLLPALGAYQNIQNTRQQRDNMKAQEQLIRTQNNIGLITLLDRTQTNLARSPFYQANAQVESEQKYYSALNTWRTGELKDQVLQAGLPALQARSLEASNKLKAQQLTNYSLDAAILEQKKSLNQMDIDIRKSLGGLKTSDVTSGFSALRGMAGLLKKAPKFSKATKFTSLSPGKTSTGFSKPKFSGVNGKMFN